MKPSQPPLLRAWMLFMATVAHGQHCYIQNGICGPGTRLVKGPTFDDYHCERCPDGSYMDQLHHECVECKPCDKLTDERRYQQSLKITKNCTLISNTEFGCQKGFCRKKQSFPLEKEMCSPCGVTDAKTPPTMTPINSPTVKTPPTPKPISTTTTVIMPPTVKTTTEISKELSYKTQWLSKHVGLCINIVVTVLLMIIICFTIYKIIVT